MKQLLATLILFATFIPNSMAQQFIPYQPVQVDRPSNTYGSNRFGNSTTTYPQQRQQQQENLQIVNAYFINRRGTWEKLRLKILVEEGYYNRVVVKVRAYYDKIYERWQATNSTASNVDVLDSDVVKENFDWKSHIAGYGTVYF